MGRGRAILDAARQRVGTSRKYVVPTTVPEYGRKGTTTQVQRKIPIKELVDHRWHEPPPGHLAAIVEASVNACFWQGNHRPKRARYFSATGTHIRIPKQDKTRALVLNKVNRITRDMVALRMKAVPRVGAEPMTYDEADKAAARMAKALLVEIQEDPHWDLMRQPLSQAIEITGLGCLHAYYDHTAGEEVSFPMGFQNVQEDADEGQMVPIVDNNGFPIMGSLREGAIKFDVYSMFNVRFDHSVMDPNNAFWAMIGKIMHVEDARRFYNDDSIEPDGNLAFTDYLAHGTALYSYGPTSVTYENEYVFVRTLYERASVEFPYGRMMAFEGKENPEILVDEENPLGANQIPLTFFSCIPSYGTPYGMTTIKLLRHINQIVNKRLSQISEDANIVGRPKLLIEKNAQLAIKEWDNDSIEVFEYMGLQGMTHGKPEWMTAPAMPSWIINFISLLGAEMQDLSGVNDVMKGINPPGSRSGSMLAYLEEKGHSVHYPMFLENERKYEQALQHALLLARKSFNVPRLIRTTGIDFAGEAMRFMGTDLEGAVKVKAVAGSAAPRSKGARMGQIMEMLQFQMISPVEARDMIEFALDSEMHEDKRIAQNRVRSEHEAIIYNGFPIMPVDYEDHRIHWKLHNRMRRRAEYRMLPEETQRMFDAHCNLTQKYLSAMYADATTDDLAQVGTVSEQMQPQMGA